ncbi:MAG: ATP-dependent helicase [Promethearchaeota archaeon]
MQEDHDKGIDSKYKDNLNGQQLRAVRHQEGPALVIAGAGSGKTRVLTWRVARLIEEGVDPRKIMLLTFTKKAAEEMIERVCSLAGKDGELVIAGTFHHVANLYIRKHAKRFGFNPQFSILDRRDSRTLMERILKKRVGNLDKTGVEFPTPELLVDIFSKSANLNLGIKDVILKFHPSLEVFSNEIETLKVAYDHEKNGANAMDFDDLLDFFMQLLKDSVIGKKICRGIDHLLVDEYQDVNQIQADIVLAISKNISSVMVVGDDAQAIYSFRGSQIKHILQFKNLFDTKVKIYLLAVNYRSTPEILDLANASISRNKMQFKKKLVPVKEKGGVMPVMIPCLTQEDEASEICRRIKIAKNNGIPYGKQAILIRAAFHAFMIEKYLSLNGIPYEKNMGVKLFERKHVKDLLSFGVIMENPRNDLPWLRVLSLIPGMGQINSQKVFDLINLEKEPFKTFCSMDLEEALRGKRLPKVSIHKLKELRDMYLNVVKLNDTPGLDNSVEKTFKIFLEFYTTLIEENKNAKNAKKAKQLIDTKRTVNDDDERKKEDQVKDDLNNIIQKSREFTSISDFFAELIITTNNSIIKGGKNQEMVDAVQLTSVHQAKGLEWNKVFIAGMADGMFPHFKSMKNPRELEEERRLFYVATTRARDELVITYPQVTRRRYECATNSISRFIEEIEDEDVFTTFNCDYTFMSSHQYYY